MPDHFQRSTNFLVPISHSPDDLSEQEKITLITWNIAAILGRRPQTVRLDVERHQFEISAAQDPTPTIGYIRRRGDKLDGRDQTGWAFAQFDDANLEVILTSGYTSETLPLSRRVDALTQAATFIRDDLNSLVEMPSDLRNKRLQEESNILGITTEELISLSSWAHFDADNN